MAKKKHNKDKKLHNSDVVNNEPDLSWQERVDLIPEDEGESGSEIYYFTDEDDNIHSREFLAEELIPDDAEDRKDSLKRKLRHEKLQRMKPGAVEIVNLVPASGESRGRSLCPSQSQGHLHLIFGYPAKSSQSCSPKKSRRVMASKRTGRSSFIFKIVQLLMSLHALSMIITHAPLWFFILRKPNLSLMSPTAAKALQRNQRIGLLDLQKQYGNRPQVKSLIRR